MSEIKSGGFWAPKTLRAGEGNSYIKPFWNREGTCGRAALISRLQAEVKAVKAQHGYCMPPCVLSKVIFP